MSDQGKHEKQITQETFNESVLEMMEMLDLSATDALAETVNQFEIMGVDLTYIEKNEEMIGGVDETAQLTQKLEELCSTNLDKATEIRAAMIVEIMSQFQNKAMTNQAVSKRSCDLGVRTTLLKFLQTSVWPDVVHSLTITTLAILHQGYQMTLTPDEVDVMFELLRDGSLLSPTLKWLLAACKKHEKNKQIIYERGFTNIAVSFFERHVSLKDLSRLNDLENMTKILQTLTSDDDLNEDIPKFFERAVDLASKLSENILVHTAQLCDAYTQNDKVAKELGLALRLLGNLAVRDEYCKDMSDKITSNVLVEVLRRAAGDDMNLTKNVMTFIEKLARNDNVRADFGKSDIFELLEVIILSTSAENVICKTLLLISGLTLRNEDNSLRAQNLIIPIVAAMRKFEADSIQMAGVMGLYNIVSKKEQTPDLKEEIESVVRGLCDRKAELAFHAKKVLNSIGATVVVPVLWTGERGDVVGQNESA